METKELDAIELPAGNELKGYTPVLLAQSAKSASTQAHKMVKDLQRSVKWQEVKKNGNLCGAWAVYLKDKPKTVTVGKWTHIEGERNAEKDSAADTILPGDGI